MYACGGHVYVYLIYGMYWMLNIVSGSENHPEAVLIRSISETEGPGRVSKILKIDKSFINEDLNTSQRIWIEDAPDIAEFTCSPRIGIDYSGEYWKNIPWRFKID
jgi:DNA-3-methyladenine glycosylase